MTATVPPELWVILHDGHREMLTRKQAVHLMAELAYSGALPGTCAERYIWLSGKWERDCPWEDR